MKYLFALLFSFSIAFYSCQKEEIPKSAIINGVLKPAPGEMVYILPQSNCVGFKDYSSILDSIPVDSQGYFYYELNGLYDEAKAIMLINKDGYKILSYPLFVANGDSFFCDIKMEQNEFKYQITGNGNHCGEYQVVEKLRAAVANANWSRIDYSQSEDSFLLEMQKRERLTVQVINHFFDSLNINESELKKLILQDKSMSFSHDYFRFLNYHNYYANDTFLYKLDYSSQFADFLEKVNAIDPIIPFTYNHISLVENQLLFEFAHNKLDTLAYERQAAAKWDLIENSFNGTKQSAAIFYFLQNFTHTMANKDAFDLLEKAKKLASKTLSESQQEIFSIKYNELTSLKPGAPAHNFTLPNIEGEMVNLSDFKGKVIYIDFWGTWCMPCLKEIGNNNAVVD